MTLDEAVNDLLAKIHAAAKKGDQAKLRAILRDLLEPSFTDPLAEHQRRMADENSVNVCRYLGELGESRREVEIVLGHKMSKDERTAWEKGCKDRVLAVRATELHRTLNAGGAVKDWMTR